MAIDNEVDKLLKEGIANCQQGRYKTGLELLDKALQINPKNDRVLAAKGTACLLYTSPSPRDRS